MEKTREAMARELVNLTNKNEELQDQLKEYPAFKKEYNVSRIYLDFSFGDITFTMLTAALPLLKRL